MWPAIGGLITLCEDYHHVEEVEKNWVWQNYDFYKGDKFYVESKSDKRDYVLKVISSKNNKLNNLRIHHSCFDNHKFMDDVEELRNRKLESIGI